MRICGLCGKENLGLRREHPACILEARQRATPAPLPPLPPQPKPPKRKKGPRVRVCVVCGGSVVSVGKGRPKTSHLECEAAKKNAVEKARRKAMDPARLKTQRKRWNATARAKLRASKPPAERAAEESAHRTRKRQQRDARLRMAEAVPLTGDAWAAYEARLAARAAEMRGAGFRFGGGR